MHIKRHHRRPQRGLGRFPAHFWTSLLDLARHFSHLPLYWARQEAYRLWTDPLGFIQRLKPVFIFKPVEMVRGMEVQNFQLLHSMDLCQGQDTLLGAEKIIGHDSGPGPLVRHAPRQGTSRAHDRKTWSRYPGPRSNRISYLSGSLIFSIGESEEKGNEQGSKA